MSGAIRRRPSPWGVAGAACLVLLVLFTVAPMAWMLLTSIKTQFAAMGSACGACHRAYRVNKN